MPNFTADLINNLRAEHNC